MPSTSETECNCPPPPSAPHLFSSFSCGKLIHLLLFSQWTPLHRSAQCGHLEVCRLLLQCNADIEAKTSGYYPPLLLLLLIIMKRNSFCASSFFCFPSGNGPHCIPLLCMAALKLPVFWSSRKLTSLRGPSASALPPLTIFHSLSALQLRQNCTQLGHQRQKSRRCCIPAQHRRS